MGGQVDSSVVRAPAPGGPPVFANGGDNWTHFDKSVNAVYFGFVATAILVFMFLVMAVFERFLAPNSQPPVRSSGPRTRQANRDGEFTLKLDYPSPKVSLFTFFFLVIYMFTVFNFVLLFPDIFPFSCCGIDELFGKFG